jgi:hypothetical protein
VRYSLDHRVFIYDCYGKINSQKSCRRKFHHKFPETTCPSGDSISKVQTNSYLTGRRPLKRSCVLTEEKLNISQCLENSH